MGYGYLYLQYLIVVKSGPSPPARRARTPAVALAIDFPTCPCFIAEIIVSLNYIEYNMITKCTSSLKYLLTSLSFLTV